MHFSKRRKSSHRNFTFLVLKSITFWSPGAEPLIGFQNLSRALLKTISKCIFFMPEINMFYAYCSHNFFTFFKNNFTYGILSAISLLCQNFSLWYAFLHKFYHIFPKLRFLTRKIVVKTSWTRWLNSFFLCYDFGSVHW